MAYHRRRNSHNRNNYPPSSPSTCSIVSSTATDTTAATEMMTNSEDGDSSPLEPPIPLSYPLPLPSPSVFTILSTSEMTLQSEPNVFELPASAVPLKRRRADSPPLHSILHSCGSVSASVPLTRSASLESESSSTSGGYGPSNPNKSVRFAPPQSRLNRFHTTWSGEVYDRTPIQCTKSEERLELPKRDGEKSCWIKCAEREKVRYAMSKRYKAASKQEVCDEIQRMDGFNPFKSPSSSPSKAISACPIASAVASLFSPSRKLRLDVANLKANSQQLPSPELDPIRDNRMHAANAKFADPLAPMSFKEKDEPSTNGGPHGHQQDASSMFPHSPESLVAEEGESSVSSLDDLIRGVDVDNEDNEDGLSIGGEEDEDKSEIAVQDDWSGSDDEDEKDRRGVDNDDDEDAEEEEVDVDNYDEEVVDEEEQQRRARAHAKVASRFGMCGMGKWSRDEVYGACDVLGGF